MVDLRSVVIIGALRRLIVRVPVLIRAQLPELREIHAVVVDQAQCSVILNEQIAMLEISVGYACR